MPMDGMPGVPQAHAIASRLPPVPVEDPNAPHVLIPSALRLTRSQEQDMIDHVIARKDTLASELGLRDFTTPNWHVQAFDDQGQFRRRYLDVRFMAMMAYAMRYEWRSEVLGGIFKESNLHVPITRRIIQQIVARMLNYFLGSDPYFAAYDVSIEDKDLAERLERWLRHILDSENDTKSILSAIIERILVCGECPVALSYERQVSYYQTNEEVLMGADGQPVYGADRDYIIRGQDTWVVASVPQTDPATQQPVLGPDGAPIMQPDPMGSMVLKRDSVTPKPDTENYVMQSIWRETVVNEGPRATVLMPHDFLYPLNCEDIEKADCTIHIYDEPLIKLIHKILTLPDATPEEMIAYVSKLNARLSPESNHNPAAANNKGRADLNEPLDGTGQDRQQEPIINWWRVCLSFDPLQSGNVSNIMLIMTPTGLPLYYDYVENVTPDKKRPYRLPRVNPIPGRSHGMGLVEIYENLQTNADLIFNRWNFGLSRSGTVIAFQPENTMEGDENMDLEINGGETLHLKPGKTLAETIQKLDLLDARGIPLREMLDYFQQLSMNMSGVTSTNDAQTAGLDTSKTATGVRNLEKTGQELTDKIVADLRPGLKDILKALMLLAAANINSPKVFRYFNGDLGVLATITPDEVQDLTLDVELELTKYRGEQDLQQNSQAVQAVSAFYALPANIQQAAAPMYRNILKLCGQKDADQIIQPMVMPMAPAGAAAPPGAQTPPAPAAPPQPPEPAI